MDFETYKEVVVRKANSSPYELIVLHFLCVVAYYVGHEWELSFHLGNAFVVSQFSPLSILLRIQSLKFGREALMAILYVKSMHKLLNQEQIVQYVWNWNTKASVEVKVFYLLDL